MKHNVEHPSPSTDVTPAAPTPCRYCGAPRTTVIDRRDTRVLRYCDACKLSWTTEEEDEPSSHAQRQAG